MRNVRIVMVRNVWIVMMFVAVALSGCSQGGPAPTQQEGPVVEDAEGNLIVDEAPSNETAETASGKKVAVNKGVIFGRVYDDFNFSLQGTFVSVLNTDHFTETDRKGRYLLENVTVGTFDVRFEMPGFKAFHQRVKVEAASEARLDAELEPLQPRSGGFNPHVHDNWGSATSRVIMDHDLHINEGVLGGEGPPKAVAVGPLAAAQCGISTCNFDFGLPEQEDGKPATVWPGTKEMKVTFSWSDPTMVLNGVIFEYVHANATSRADSLETDPLGNGETVTIPVEPHMQDNGHSLWTQWQFWAETKNTYTTPGFVSGALHVKIELIKGEVVLDPPHEDFWQGRTEMSIGDTDQVYFPNTGVLPTAKDETGPNRVFPLDACSEEEAEAGCISIIPPGTDRLEVRFTWLPGSTTGDPPPFDYFLTYRTADQHPINTPAEDYKTPTVLEEDLDEDWRLYEIEVASEETDPFYHARSGWAFKWHQDSDLDHNVLQTEYRMTIEVTAFREASS